MICKIKKAVVPEPWGSPPRSGGEECFWSILGLFFFSPLFIFFGRGSRRALEKESGTFGIPLGLF